MFAIAPIESKTKYVQNEQKYRNIMKRGRKQHRHHHQQQQLPNEKKNVNKKKYIYVCVCVHIFIERGLYFMVQKDEQ